MKLENNFTGHHLITHANLTEILFVLANRISEISQFVVKYCKTGSTVQRHLLNSVLHFGWLMETSSPQDDEANKANQAMIEINFLFKNQNREISANLKIRRDALTLKSSCNSLRYRKHYEIIMRTS